VTSSWFFIRQLLQNETGLWGWCWIFCNTFLQV